MHPCTQVSQVSRDFSICWSPWRYSLWVEEISFIGSTNITDVFCVRGTSFQAGDSAPGTLTIQMLE